MYGLAFEEVIKGLDVESLWNFIVASFSFLEERLGYSDYLENVMRILTLNAYGIVYVN